MKLIGYSHDGASILLNNSKSVIVLNAVTGAESRRITQQEDIGEVTLSPDDKRLAIVAMTKHVAHIWDLEKNAEISQIQVKAASPEIVRSIDFSPDGRQLLVSHAGYSIVWDANTGETITELHGHSNRSVVTVSRFSPDGSRIVTAATDNTARVWDAVNGELIKTFRAITGEVPTAAFYPSAAFSPDGKFVAFEADDKSLRLWNTENAMMPTGQLIDTGCKRLADLSTLNASEMHLVGLDRVKTNVNVCAETPLPR
jgi:WD40 repeat protein